MGRTNSTDGGSSTTFRDDPTQAATKEANNIQTIARVIIYHPIPVDEPIERCALKQTWF